MLIRQQRYDEDTAIRTKEKSGISDITTASKSHEQVIGFKVILM